MQLSVIITTYNSEEWLAKVLEGYCNQTEKNFEVVVADDGSSEKTKLIIDTFRDKFEFPIQHIWQEDNGFQKCKILNKAILKTILITYFLLMAIVFHEKILLPNI